MGFQYVLVIQQGHTGHAKDKGLRMFLRQGEDAPQILPGLVGVDPVAGEPGVQTPGAFDVHEKLLGQAFFQKRLDHVRPLAVAVHLDGQADAREVLEQGLQPFDAAGFAAGDHYAVQPALAFGQGGQDARTRQRRQVLVSPGQFGVMAGGAAQIAAAAEEHHGVVSRPVAKAQGLQAANHVPGPGQKFVGGVRPIRPKLPWKQPALSDSRCPRLPGGRAVPGPWPHRVDAGSGFHHENKLLCGGVGGVPPLQLENLVCDHTPDV